MIKKLYQHLETYNVYIYERGRRYLQSTFRLIDTNYGNGLLTI